MSDGTNWEGVPGAPEHRTVGPHRAWCFNDSEWCYPDQDLMCPCCHGTLGHEQVWFDPAVGPPERAILTDLIAELRHHCGEVCRCDIAQSADRAEARLSALTGAEAQEVTDSNVYGSIALGEVYGE